MSRTMITFAFALASATSYAQPGATLTGDTRLACEAMLCLSSGQPPHECDPALQRYFSIKHKKLSDTLKARQDFLNLCPMQSSNANSNSNSGSLGAVPANAATRCDVAALNDTNLVGAEDGSIYISNAMPSYCTAYTGSGYANPITLPLYVGDPTRGGFWVDPLLYDQALRDYNARGGYSAGGTLVPYDTRPTPAGAQVGP